MKREIGIDSAGKTIIKMPDDRNYGYWTDNNLLLGDFKSHFNAIEFETEEFSRLWNQ